MYIDLYAYYHDGKLVPATMVHHIIPVSKDYTKRLDRDNLIPLSDKRHGIVHKQMKEGREEEKGEGRRGEEEEGRGGETEERGRRETEEGRGRAKTQGRRGKTS